MKLPLVSLSRMPFAALLEDRLVNITFNGVLLAEKSDKGFAGDLKASSGDSLTVRKASVVLSKKDAKGN